MASDAKPPGVVILVAVDTTEACVKAFNYVIKQVYRPGDIVCLVHVAAVLTPTETILHAAPQTLYNVASPPTIGGSITEMQEQVEKFLKARFIEPAAAKGVNCYHRVYYTSQTTPANEIADAILNAADEEKANLLAIGVHPKKPLLTELIMGSVAKVIMAKAELPILLIKDSVAQKSP